MARTVVLTGGGIKSAVVAGRAAGTGEVVLLHVDFGQPAAAAQRKAIRALAEALHAERVVTLDMPHVLQLDAQLGRGRKASPRGRSKEDTARRVTQRAGLFPVLVTAGLQCAQRLGGARVATGLSRWCDAAHVGLIGAAARAESVHAMIHTLACLTDGPAVRGAAAVEAPLIDLTYAQVIELGGRFNVPLDRTWTCEGAGRGPCGRCDPCRARAAGFVEAALPDPVWADEGAASNTSHGREAAHAAAGDAVGDRHCSSQSSGTPE